jgi:hypothetical protein
MNYAYEEAAIGARAWTSGWDMFCPNKIIARHTWERWRRFDDDNYQKYIAEAIVSQRRTRHLFRIEDCVNLGEYGLGEERTLSQYEVFCGVYWADQIVTSQADWGRVKTCVLDLQN